MNNNYVEQAETFLQNHNTIIDISYLKTDKYFPDDKEKRDIYSIKISRTKGTKTTEYAFNFGDSIHNTEKNQEKQTSYTTGRKEKTGRRKQICSPSAYDILACLQKYEIGDFDDFVSDFGYTFGTEREFVKVKQIYFSVVDEYKNVYRLFSDCMDELQEIC